MEHGELGDRVEGLATGLVNEDSLVGDRRHHIVLDELIHETAGSRLVDVRRRDPGRITVLFNEFTFLIWVGAYLPLLGEDFGWITITLPPGLPFLGILSPALAALLIHLYDDRLAGVRNVLGGLTAWRFGRTWWAVTLALTLLHAGTNLWIRLMARLPSTTPAATVFTAANILLAVVLVVIYGGDTLTDPPSLPGR
jgi:apolipoprotein N-acyltransferase